MYQTTIKQISTGHKKVVRYPDEYEMAVF